METIRTGYCIAGTRMLCQYGNDRFVVQSRWQVFHRTADIHEALAVFEGLCLEEHPTKRHTRFLVREARRNRRSRFRSNATWERRVIECARRRGEGLMPVICGSKGAIEHWVPRADRPRMALQSK